jgi:hypothetical protein
MSSVGNVNGSQPVIPTSSNNGSATTALTNAPLDIVMASSRIVNNQSTIERQAMNQSKAQPNKSSMTSSNN